MKDPFGRTKAVIRQLPPTLSQPDFFQQIDDHFGSRYNWSCFRPGKSSHKHQRHARAYINFNTPEDVFEFAEFFDGHVFVNEKGAQYKVIVEYAPSQRVPKSSIKKDVREGTIYKDPDYLEFLKVIAKPVEHLPSAEIQLERKEAEQAGTGKENPVVTPLMEFVRQKRAAESGMQGSLTVGKVRRRGTASLSKSGSVSSKRSAEKKKYMFKENAKGSGRKGKSFVVVARREEQRGKETVEIENVSGIEGSVSGIPLTIDSGKKKILLLKGKGREGPQVSEGTSQQQCATSHAGNSSVSTAPKQNQRREASGRLIRSIILSNDARQSSSGSQQKKQNLNADTGKRPARSISHSGSADRGSNNGPNAADSDGDAKRALDDRYTKDSHGLGVSEKAEKRIRNRDRPDHGVWALRRSDVSHPKTQVSPSSSQPPTEGSSRQYGRRGGGHNLKDDGSFIAAETKASRRGVASNAIHEQKQVWVQKSSGS